jgi:hypothetical protein
MTALSQRNREGADKLRRFVAFPESVNGVGQLIGGSAMKKNHLGIDTASKPSGNGCVECLAAEGWWLHLRRCAQCGHIGCCDSSPSQHASKHFASTGHPVIASFEPGEDWFFDYGKQRMIKGVELPPPHSHPATQPAPGPAGRVPSDWEALLH